MCRCSHFTHYHQALCATLFVLVWITELLYSYNYKRTVSRLYVCKGACCECVCVCLSFSTPKNTYTHRIEFLCRINATWLIAPRVKRSTFVYESDYQLDYACFPIPLIRSLACSFVCIFSYEYACVLISAWKTNG